LRAKQYSVKIYETVVEDEAKFMAFFDTHHILFKNHLIVIQGELSDTIKEYLENKSLTYVHNVLLPKSNKKQTTNSNISQTTPPASKEAKPKKEVLPTNNIVAKLENNLIVKDEMIRSGQELKIDGDLLLLNRVNSGATIITSGNLIITHVVEGSIRCHGKFMMLTASPKANIIFHGVEVENDLLENKLNRVELKGNKIVITPVLKKEINWA